ncbi:hypothetical protein [Microbacterium aurantiacum]|uniref:Uncharacterized protein n=1 Tax=Microbacterium aurantiacum TaxID=162393 RepID=A0ABT8FRH1_9MICO|nr:hypothetical protein [Microbacterium aurantiacum]MDN4463904.1 hypothetical protein [Microbacterium aurantiacum]
MSLDDWRRDRIAQAEREGEVIAVTGPRSLATPGAAAATAERYVSAWERATTFQIDAADVTADQLRAAALVLRAIADVDLRPLERRMTTDSCGNPIRITPEQAESWSTYCEAMDVRDRALGWMAAIERGADRRLSLDE